MPSPASLTSSDSLPDLLSCSDLDNLDEFYTAYNCTTNMNTAIAITTYLPRTSSTVYLGEKGKPPVVTPGKITPNLLFDFKNGAYSYFSFKDIKPDKEVAKIAGGLQDACVQTWYHLNLAAIDTAGFPTFMKVVRTN